MQKLALARSFEQWTSKVLGRRGSDASLRRLDNLCQTFIFRPAGARSIHTSYPRLTPWAAFLRRFAAVGIARRVQNGFRLTTWLSLMKNCAGH
jgi:hypothetical protein